MFIAPGKELKQQTSDMGPSKTKYSMEILVK